MTDLSEFTTEALMDELDRRSIAMICAMIEPDDAGQDITRYWLRGHPVTNIGLGVLLARSTRRQMMSRSIETPEDDD